MDARRSGLKAWPVFAILFIQVILLLGHWMVYSTWVAFWPWLPHAAKTDLRIAMFVLSFTFVVAALLAFRFSNPAVRILYNIAAVWLGFLNFFFWAALLVRLCWIALRLSQTTTHLSAYRPLLVGIFYALAALTGIYGLINARIFRVRRICILLPNLPTPWRGRRAVLFSDLHLGTINGVHFCQRLVAAAGRLKPDVVFLPGDLFDGTKGDLDSLIGPLRALNPPFGLHFSTGNHEEFHDTAEYLEAIMRAGIRVLANEKVTIDGLQVAGVFYHDSTHIIQMKAVLDGMHLDPSQASILLNHAPTRLPIVEQAGFSLQLSGHTHGGQLFPYTFLTRRVFGRFTTGLGRFGKLQVYTSSGAGTWGPPMRVGTRPEIVLIEFN